MQTKKLISGIDVLKFIMAIFVVVIHLRPFRYASNFVQLEVGNVTSLAVPVFFTISSFLLFRKFNASGGH